MVEIDVENALKNLGNNVALYNKVVKSFIAEYEDSIPKLEDFIASSFLDAVRFVHTLKGLSGTVGAKGLQNACINLELSLKETSLKDDCAKKVAELKVVLGETISKLKSMIDS